MVIGWAGGGVPWPVRCGRRRAGRYRHPQIHEEVVHLKGIEHPIRQIAIRKIGHDQPTLLITNDLTTLANDLFTRYAERMIIENELDADISGFHLNALASGLPLNVDLDTTLSVLAGNCYRLLARKLPRYELATPAASGAISSAPPAPSHSPPTTSASTSPCAPTPRAHRRRFPRTQHPHPLVGRQDPPLRLPTTLTKTSTRLLK